MNYLMYSYPKQTQVRVMHRGECVVDATDDDVHKLVAIANHLVTANIIGKWFIVKEIPHD